VYASWRWRWLGTHNLALNRLVYFLLLPGQNKTELTEELRSIRLITGRTGTGRDAVVLCQGRESIIVVTVAIVVVIIVVVYVIIVVVNVVIIVIILVIIVVVVVIVVIIVVNVVIILVIIVVAVVIFVVVVVVVIVVIVVIVVVVVVAQISGGNRWDQATSVVGVEALEDGLWRHWQCLLYWLGVSAYEIR
jgi:hypothetical protein